MTGPVEGSTSQWRDPALDTATRVAALIESMSLPEKVAQLSCAWIGVDSSTGEVAPHQGDMDNAVPLEELLANGLGQLTRPFGSDPVEPAAGAKALAEVQRSIAQLSRLGIPAMAHEECLAGFTAWQATCYPVPLSWGATFNPDLVQAMSGQIGHSMRSVGIHQGLAPVLDVVRDPRWGRVEETIGEDPYLVATIGTAYVKGLEASGIVATLKHFAGYSTSRAARNLAPATAGRREMADVILPPFEMAVLEGQVRSVMPAYTDLDGVPMTMHGEYLTGLLREAWGFTGTVVADYFAIGFLKLLHGVAETWGQAAALALSAGMDVEMPNTKAFGQVLVEEVQAGRVDSALVDRSLERVLRQKCELGLLNADWNPNPPCLEAGAAPPDFDPPESRDLARQMAEQAVVLIKNNGLLPVAPKAVRRIALIGPLVNDPYAMLGCYSFPNHKGVHYPDLALGVDIPTVLEAVTAEFPEAQVDWVEGCQVAGTDPSGVSAAAEMAASADLTLLVVGDRAGLFGHGTSGEGCDAADLALPGVQNELLEAVLDHSAACVVVGLTGRPYALGSAPERAAAILQGFFLGEEGASAVAGILSGRVNPSGRLPISIPAKPGAQPFTYLGAPLTWRSKVSNLDPTPAFAFGHGLSYSNVEWSDFTVDGVNDQAGDAPTEVATDGQVDLALRLTNTDSRPTTEIVQVYLHDPVASVVQPVIRLIGYARVDLPPLGSGQLEFALPMDLVQFTGVDYQRVVEPGLVEFRVARSSAQPVFTAVKRLTGPTRVLGIDRARHPCVSWRVAP